MAIQRLLFQSRAWAIIVGGTLAFFGQVCAEGAIGFDDSDPSFMRFWNTAYYEVAIRKTDGRVLYIQDKTTGQEVSPGNAYGPWAARFSDNTWLEGRAFSPGNPTRLFSYAWDAVTSTLTLSYAASGSHAVQVLIVLQPTDGPELDSQITLLNGSTYEIEYLTFPTGLAFRRSEIRGVYVPYMEGMKLLPNFFDDTGWDFLSGYPSQLFADFAFADLSSGTLSLFGVRDLAQPLFPSGIQIMRDATFAGGVAEYASLCESIAISPGQQWTSPTRVICVGATLDQAMASYWTRNGHDAMPTLADKLDPPTLATVSGAVLVKWDFWWGGMTFPQFQAYLSNLPADSLLHFVVFWPRGFDENYPDYLPPNPDLGTLAEFQQLTSYARSTGHLVMPYTNPTWWDDESPTVIALGADIAVRNRDGSYRYEVYGAHGGNPGNGGYVVCPYDPRVIIRQDQTRTEFTATVPCDFLFEDQIGARGGIYDGHPAAPDPMRYTQGLVDVAARSATFLPIMSENGFDRVSWYETGFCGSHRVNWHPWPSSTYETYPMTQQWAHENLVFYTHNLAWQTMTNDLAALTYHVALGYCLSYDPVATPDFAWLGLLDKFQKRLVSSLVGVGLDAYDLLPGGNRTRTSFSNGVRVAANWDPTPFAYLDHVIDADGFLAHQGSTVLAGVLTTLYGQPLSGPDPHYLIFEYPQNTIIVSQPRGDDTPLTLPIPTSWTNTGGIRLEAVAEDGTRFDQPLTLQAGYLLFDYLAEVQGQAIDHFLVSCSPCSPGDLDGDGDVDLADFTLFAACFGLTAPNPPGCPPETFAGSDLDGDGDVDLADFVMFAQNFTG